MNKEDFEKYQEIISFLDMTVEKAMIFENEKQPMLSAECMKCVEKIVYLLIRKFLRTI